MTTLKSLRAPSRWHRVEETEDGFFIVRAEPGAASRFNNLVRDVMQHAGQGYVALPVPEGGPGYSRVFILPTD